MVKIIAHRGASLEERENSLAAFERAIELGCDAIELDLHLTADGVPVCHHDPTVGSQRIEELPLAKLNLPTLSQALNLAWNHPLWMVELKNGGANERLIETVVKIAGQKPKGTIFLGSLSSEMVEAIGKRWPRKQLIGIVESEAELAGHRAAGPALLALHFSLASKERVDELTEAGYEIWCWTVDSRSERDRLARNGVSGIITNDPRGLIA